MPRPCSIECADGGCRTILASGITWPGSLALQGDRLVFSTGGTAQSNFGDCTIMAVPRACGSAVTLATRQRSIADVATNDATAYWLVWGTFVSASSDSSLNRLMALPKAGGAPRLLSSGLLAPTSLAVDAANAYWTDARGSVMQLPLDGGSPLTLASGLDFSTAIAVDATHVYWANEGTTGHASGSGSLMSVPIGGGTPTTLASAGMILSGTGVAVDATSVYWAYAVYDTRAGVSAATVGAVMRVPRDGGAPETLATGQNGPVSIAVDATHVYWLNQGVCEDGAVMKLALDGGVPVTLAAGQKMPMRLVLDDAFVYWTNGREGTVVRMPKN